MPRPACFPSWRKPKIYTRIHTRYLVHTRRIRTSKGFAGNSRSSPIEHSLRFTHSPDGYHISILGGKLLTPRTVHRFPLHKLRYQALYSTNIFRGRCIRDPYHLSTYRSLQLMLPRGGRIICTICRTTVFFLGWMICTRIQILRRASERQARVWICSRAVDVDRDKLVRRAKRFENT